MAVLQTNKQTNKSHKQACSVSSGWGRGFLRPLGPQYSRNLTITQDPRKWGRTNFGPAQTTEPPRLKPLIVIGVDVGLFEEEEEGNGIASEVVKVPDDDPATPGSWVRGRQRGFSPRASRVWKNFVHVISPRVSALFWTFEKNNLICAGRKGNPSGARRFRG